MKNFKIISILFFFNMSLFSNNDLEKVSLQLSWKNQFQFAGYYMAKEKGYYEDAGIDVDINEFQFGMNLSNVLENNTADFAIGRSSLLIDKSNGKDIVALFGAFQNSPLILLVREDSNIRSVKDLKNKKIMITDDAQGTASILAMLSSQKIYTNDIKVQMHSFNLDDLIDGKTDAMGSYISNEPIRLEEKGIKYTIFDPKDYGFNFYSDILFTSSSFIEKNPELTKKFYEATIKGWKYAFDNIGKTSHVIYSEYNTQGKSLVHLVAEGEALKKLAYTQEVKEIGHLDKDNLQKIVDIYKVMGLMDHDIDLDKFIYEHNNHMALNLKLTENELIIYGLISFMIVGMLVFTIVYISIRRKWLHTTVELLQEIDLKTKQLKEQNYLDVLTGAKNRKAYDEKIKEHISLFKRYNNKFSLLMLDIDDFKEVNDSYGHKIGDKVLIDFVKIVKSNIRKNDFLFRIGGEEFVIILSETDLSSSKNVAENIRLHIEKELISMDNNVVTVSMGLSEVQEEDNEDLLFNRADVLLYTAKKNGKNQVSY